MGSTENPYMVRLDVTDFGPIAEASVELRPLTVFIGPSNTGKMYLATLTYALHRFFSGTTQRAEFTAETGLSHPMFASILPFFLWKEPIVEEGELKHEVEVMAKWFSI